MSTSMVHASATGSHVRLGGPAPAAPAPVPARAEHPPQAQARTEAEDARFRAMVDAHFDAVWRTLRGLGVRESTAEDAAQHVFLIALGKLSQIVSGSERAFLLGTAAGVAANARRGNVRAREVVDPDAVARELDPSPDPEEQALLGERRALLERVLDTMAEELRTVFVLFELEGLTSIEIGDALDIPVGTAASRLRRAREHFQVHAARLSSEPTTRRRES